MTRRRFIYDPQTKGMVEVSVDHRAPQRQAPHVRGDLEDYTSPVTGLVVHGRRGRRDDLKRHGCRPYEGRQAEQREADRQRAYAEQKSDARLHEAASRAFHSLSPQKRRALEST
jgi:hypothetical protein